VESSDAVIADLLSSIAAAARVLAAACWSAQVSPERDRQRGPPGEALHKVAEGTGVGDGELRLVVGELEAAVTSRDTQNICVEAPIFGFP
jgi:hypothetical protein